jgi:cob(I)alamin adenosyltransferase
MGNRLSKIITRTGDQGTTGLGDGSRVSKIHARIEAIGEVDECNSTVGVLLTHTLPSEIRQWLVSVQHDLFDLGGELSIPGYVTITEQHIERLEQATFKMNETMPPLKDFILPGGSPQAAQAHIVRTVARRAERRVVALAEAEPESINPFLRQYLNRLSDFMFVLCRELNRVNNVPDVLWQKHRGQA